METIFFVKQNSFGVDSQKLTPEQFAEHVEEVLTVRFPDLKILPAYQVSAQKIDERSGALVFCGAISAEDLSDLLHVAKETFKQGELLANFLGDECPEGMGLGAFAIAEKEVGTAILSGEALFVHNVQKDSRFENAICLAKDEDKFVAFAITNNPMGWDKWADDVTSFGYKIGYNLAVEQCWIAEERGFISQQKTNRAVG